MKMYLSKHVLFICISIALTTSACKNDSANPQPVNQIPIVDFSYAGELIAPATVTFTNNTLLGKTFEWDFGNGITSALQNPVAVTYTQPGSYDVVLKATNVDKSASQKKTIVVTANTNPVALFSYTYKNNKSTAPATIDFVNESLNADSYEWDINGVSHISTNPSNVTFNFAGDYKVKLIAIKGNNRSPVYESTVTVLANTDPLARFVFPYHPYPYSVGEEIQLINKSLNSDEWTWTFGANGPGPSSDQHPVIKFAAAGVHTITLVAKKSGKVSAAFSINLKIN